MFMLALLNMVVVIVYNRYLKRMPIGNFFPAWLAASAFLFGGLLIGGIKPILLLLFMMAFFSNVGREIVKAIEDMPGDAKIKAKTLPIVVGRNFASGVAMMFIIFAMLVAPLPYAFNIFGLYYIAGVSIAVVLFAVSCFVILVNPAKAQKIMKIAMFVAIISFLIGVL